MELTAKQKEALRIAVERYKQKKERTVIAGYAGTGKTTVVKYITEELGKLVGKENIAHCAFTGKATQVLRDKGNSNALTIHKLMYVPEMEKGRLIGFNLKDNLDYKVIIVDECSMVPASMVRDLAYFGVYTIYVGDPGQLPPVDDNSNNYLLDTPDIFLDEVMRQAEDSGVIKLSMKIRNGEDITGFTSNNAVVISQYAVTDELLKSADIIICGTNKRREALNSYMRGVLGKQGRFDKEEKVICNTNYWDVVSERGDPLTNGSIGIIRGLTETTETIHTKVKSKGINLDCLYGDFKSEYGADFGKITIDENAFLNNTKLLEDWQLVKYRGLVKEGKFPSKTLADVPMSFSFAYAITCHKSQGSEWDRVVVFEERFPFDSEDHKRWLYTACTRAKKFLVIVRA